jgi:G3E family GTPase
MRDTGGHRKGLLSVVTGNTPGIRGDLVAHLGRTHPGSVVLSLSLQEHTAGRYPVVQRLMTTAGTRSAAPPGLGTTGDPVTVLRQDLISVRRAQRDVHVILVLPEHVDVLPFLLRLWHARTGAESLEDHFDAAPVLVGVDTVAFLADVTCVHRTVRVWGGDERGEPLTRAETAARQAEAADALVLTASAPMYGRQGQTAAGLLRHLNARAGMITLRRLTARQPAAARALTRPLVPAQARAGWEERLDPVAPPSAHPGTRRAVTTTVWRSRRPLHPERLAHALGETLPGVLRSRGHLWLAGAPDTIVTWRSAGGQLEIREAGRWLEAPASPAWDAATPLRRTLACWFWDDYYGERRNEIAFTGPDPDLTRIAGALDHALLTDAELTLGPEGWSHWHNPLFGEAEAH